MHNSFAGFLTAAALSLSCLISGSVQAMTYALPETGSRLIGENTEYVVQNDGRSLESISAQYNVGLLAMLQANPGVDPFLPAPGSALKIPHQMLLPDAPHEGIVVNLSELRLYHYSPDGKTVSVYPVGIGQIDDQTITPVMTTHIVQKRKNPTWTPTENIRRRYLEKGIVLPAVMPAGNNNPMGHHALRLGAFGGVYLIHGTNAEFGIGMRVSSGCIRLRNSDIEALFRDVPIGTVVRITNEPVKVSIEPDGSRYIEVHQPVSESLNDDPVTRSITLSASVRAFRNDPLVSDEIFDSAIEQRNGMPLKM